MRNHQFLAVSCALSLLLGFSACKKAETPAPARSQAEPPTAPRGSTPPPPAAKAAPRNEQPSVLQVKWPLGNRYTFRMDMDQQITNKVPMMPQPMRQNVTMAMTYAINVASETPQGGRELELEFLANEMEIKMADQVMMSFDSKETDKSAQNPFTEPFRKMIGSKLRLQTDASGHVEKVLNLEEWQSALSGGAAGPASGMLAQQFNEAYFRQIADFGKGLPEKPVRPGETWPVHFDMPAGPVGKISIDSTVTWKDWEQRQEHKCAALNAVGTFSGSGEGMDIGPMGKMSLENGKLTATTWFDPDLGMVIESTSDQTMHMKGQMNAPQNDKNQPAPSFTIDLGQKVTLTLVEMKKL